MFCGKCGSKMDDNLTVCPRCGWQLPHGVKTPVRSVSSAPDNFDYDEPSRQSFGVDEYFPPVPKEFRQPMPAAMPVQPAAQKVKPKKKVNKALIITLIAVGVALAAAVGILITLIIRNNSDDYKIDKAESEILAGNYDEGYEIIEDVSAPQANAMRDFANVIRCRDNFKKVFDPNVYQNGDDTVDAAAKELIKAYDDFKSYDDLPTGLRGMYDSISGKMAGRKSALDALSRDDLKNAQNCVLEYKLRKEGKHFTIPELEAIIAASEPAVKSLENNLINTDAYKKFSGSSDALAVKDMNTLLTTVSTQVSQDKFDLQEYQKTKKRDDSLWFQNIVRRYDAVVGDGLKYLNRESDLVDNAEALYTELSYAWLAYAFETN